MRNTILSSKTANSIGPRSCKITKLYWTNTKIISEHRLLKHWLLQLCFIFLGYLIAVFCYVASTRLKVMLVMKRSLLVKKKFKTSNLKLNFHRFHQEFTDWSFKQRLNHCGKINESFWRKAWTLIKHMVCARLMLTNACITLERIFVRSLYYIRVNRKEFEWTASVYVYTEKF